MKKIFLLSLLALQTTYIAATQEKCEICFTQQSRHVGNNGHEDLKEGIDKLRTTSVVMDIARAAFGAAIISAALFEALKGSCQRIICPKCCLDAEDPASPYALVYPWVLYSASMIDWAKEMGDSASALSAFEKDISFDTYYCRDTASDNLHLTLSKSQYDSLKSHQSDRSAIGTFNMVFSLLPAIYGLWLGSQSATVQSPAAKPTRYLLIAALAVFFSKFGLSVADRDHLDDMNAILDEATVRNCTSTTAP